MKLKSRLSMTLSTAMWVASSLEAATVNYNPAPTLDTGWNACGAAVYAALAGKECRTTAYFEADSLATYWAGNPGGLAPIFNVGFDAWNTKDNKSTNPPGTNQGWTATKGATPVGAFDVNPATAQQFGGVTRGGLTIEIALSAALQGNLPALAANEKITWVQALYDNYLLTPPGTVIPFYEMDTTSATNPSYTDSYPVQPANNGFYDQPNFRYLPLGNTQAFFYATAYLAVQNSTAKTLVLLDGVDYGWNNYVRNPLPEPTTLVLLVAVGPLFVRRSRRRCVNK